MWEQDHTESWELKNWCFWTVVLEKTLESPLDSQVIKPIHPKGNQSWMFIGRTDAEAETPILCLPDGKNWLIWKDPDAGKDWRREEKGMTEDKMVGWMASSTPWTWVWVNSGCWWWSRRPAVLQSMGSQRLRHDWGLNRTDNSFIFSWSLLSFPPPPIISTNLKNISPVCLHSLYNDKILLTLWENHDMIMIFYIVPLLK